MRRLVPALAIPTFLILLAASSGFALAQEWDQPQVSLEPGESVVVEFANETENPITLNRQNISAPSELLSFVTFSPWVISENSSKNVCITFLPVIENVRQGIMPDNYAVQINGASSGLIVILNMSGNFEGIPHENYASQIDALTQRVGDLEGRPDPSPRLESLEEWADNFLAWLETLEDAPSENWADEIESVRLLMLAELDNIRNTIPENSPAENSDNLKEAIVAEIEEYIDITVAPQLKRDHQEDLAKIRSERETDMIYAAVVAAIVAIIVVAGAGKFGMIKKTFGTHIVSKTGPTDEVTDDQIAMLENKIGAMRERGESVEAEELKLKFLKDRQELLKKQLKKQQELEKPKEEKPVEKKPEVE